MNINQKRKSSFLKLKNTWPKEINLTVPAHHIIFHEKKLQNNLFQFYFSTWQKTYTLHSRASRMEFLIFWSITLLLFQLIEKYFLFYPFVEIVFPLVCTPTLFSLTIRRFHDQNKSMFIPCVLFVYIFILLIISNEKIFSFLYPSTVLIYFFNCFLPGSKHENKYGNPPIPPTNLTYFFGILLAIPFLFLINGFAKILLIFIKGV